MRPLILILYIGILIILLGCGNETFSPTYHDTACVPAQGLAWEEATDPLQSAEASTSSNICCENSGIVACCFGGSYLCADGTTGVGCGCPTN